MDFRRFSVFLCVAFVGNLCWAQQPGTVEYNTVLLPALGAGDARKPSPNTFWGAFSIAMLDEGEALLTGWAIDYETEAKARQESLDMCARRGGKGCEIHLVFMNQCAVVTTSSAGIFAARDRTLRLSRRAARRSCASDCRILYEGCTSK